MALVKLIGGPWHGKRVKLPDGNSACFALGVDQQLRPILAQQDPFAFSGFQRTTNNSLTAEFTGLVDRNGQPLVFRLVGGPFDGDHIFSKADSFLNNVLVLQVWRNGSFSEDPDDLVAVALYETDVASSLHFRFQKLDEKGGYVSAMRKSLKIAIIRNAVTHFYASPNYNAYSRKPTKNHPQLVIELYHRKAEVDELLAPLILALWSNEIETFGSCQGDEGERAYVGIAILEQGKRLYEAALNIGLDVELVPKAMTVVSKNAPDKKIRFETANILFWRQDLPAIVALLK